MRRMSELRTHAPGPWWVEELTRSDVTPHRIPTAWMARHCAAQEQRHPLRGLAHQRQHAYAPFNGGRVFHRCVA